MSGCQIQSILNTINSKEPGDLNGYCSQKYRIDPNFSLNNNETCTVTTDKNTSFTKGSIFTCQNGKIVNNMYTLNSDNKTYKGSDGNVYYFQNGSYIPVTGNPCTTGTDPNASSFVYEANGSCVPKNCNQNYTLTNGVCEPVPTTPAPTTLSPTTMGGVSQDVAPKTNKMIYIIAAIVIMLFVFGLIMFMKKPKIVSAFGKKLFKCR